MKTYLVKIESKQTAYYKVEADSWDEAEEKVDELFFESDFDWSAYEKDADTELDWSVEKPISDDREKHYDSVSRVLPGVV